MYVTGGWSTRLVLVSSSSRGASDLPEVSDFLGVATGSLAFATGSLGAGAFGAEDSEESYPDPERRKADMLERKKYQQETSQDPRMHPTRLGYWLAPSWDKRVAPPEGPRWGRADKDPTDEEAMDQLKNDLGITKKHKEDPLSAKTLLPPCLPIL